jgi:hypothetical protein
VKHFTESIGKRIPIWATCQWDYIALELRQRGKSYGEIAKLVFRKFGDSWDISTIEHAIKKHKKSKSILNGKEGKKGA